MSHGIKLLGLSVKDVGVLTGRVDLGPFAGGVNVISGRNEAGKSTLVEALRAALFERHDAKNQKIKALQTHGTRNAPEVWVELEIGGEPVSVHKRFLEDRLTEVRLHREGTVVHGADAEDLLLARLEARRPGRTGGTRSDMGVWGLLWVAQDETAYADPGAALDEGVRGTLSEVIGRQVGQVLGGKHGERVRTRVLDHAARYFTPKTAAPTGEFRTARERQKEVETRVKEIAEAQAAVQALAAEHRALCEQLREEEQGLVLLEREQADAIVAERRVHELEGALRDADAGLSLAQASLRAVEQEVDARAALARDAEQLSADIERGDQAAAELAHTRTEAQGAAARARTSADDARSAVARARAALDAATEDHHRGCRQDEAARLAQALCAAEAVAGELAAAQRLVDAEALDEHTFEQLEGIAAKATALRARLDTEGTRVVVFPPEGQVVVWSVGAPTTIEVPGLGVLHVEPARPGLAEARADLEKRRAQLEEALLALGVADVPAAKDRHAARAEAAREEMEIVAELGRLAPEGLESLEAALRAGRTERARLEAALEEARRADLEIEESLRGLAANRLDDAAMDELRRREREVAVLRAACDAAGTRVEVIALRDVRVHVEGGGVVRGLTAGDRLALTSTLGTTVTLEEVAEVRLEPRGADLAALRAKLDRAERELAAALRAHGIAAVTDAVPLSRAWAELAATRRRAEERVAELAPRGVPELRAALEKARAQSTAADAELAKARSALARRARIQVDLAENRVTREALDRAVAFERALGEAEAEIARRQARVRAVAGPVAALPQRVWEVADTVRPDAVNGQAWEIIPGTFGAGLDVDGLERRLRDALESVAADDLDVAKARFKARLVVDAKLVELRKQLQGLAPDGLDALHARAGALGGVEVKGDPTATDVDLEALRAVVDERREEARSHEANARSAAEVAERADRELRVLDGSLGEAAAVRHEKAARLLIVSDKLAALRQIEPDAALHDRRTAAGAQHERASARARVAADALDAVAPHLLRGEVTRAEGAVASHRKAIAALHDEVLRRKVLLDKAALEGRFEELTDAQVEHLEAAADLARLERQASTARLLSEVVESTYAESQRLFLAPVVNEAKPYLARLRPGTDLRMTRDLKLDKVLRRGNEEDFGQLSGGTREQLSVIVRLALARVLAKDKRPLPLILDDTMGWTDDWRFLSMVQILRDAASELQIILLTCHPARFDRFQAEYVADLDRLRGAERSEGTGAS